MSSHPRTVVVCAAPVENATEYYADLIRSAEYVVAVDDGATLCRRIGRHPDIVVGDLDSIDAATASWAERDGVEVLAFPSDKDVTDLDLALEEMRRSARTGICVTASWTGRLDHTVAALGSISRYGDLEISLRDPGMSGWVLDGEHRPRVALAPKGAAVSLIATTGAACVSCSGMRYPLTRHTLDVLSSRGVSNVIAAAEADVCVHEGTVCVISSDVGARSCAHALTW